MNPSTQGNPAVNPLDQAAELGHVLEPIYQRLAARFASSFAQESGGARTVGREAEFPNVGLRVEAVEARRLWNVWL